VYQTCPSANYFDCKAMAVGSRSQSARTYLEKHLEEFLDCDTDELIKHGLRALRDTLPNEVELNTKVMSSSSLYSFLCKIKFEELIYLILSLFTYSDHQIMVSI
jgi:20S proteasome alpha/beta subunit